MQERRKTQPERDILRDLVSDSEAMNALTERFDFEHRERARSLSAFYHSPTCSRMISDIIRCGYPLESEQVAHFPEQMRLALGWRADVTDEHIDLFFDALTNPEFPYDSPPARDGAIPEDNISFRRRGLRVLTLLGSEGFIRIERA